MNAAVKIRYSLRFLHPSLFSKTVFCVLNLTFLPRFYESIVNNLFCSVKKIGEFCLKFLDGFQIFEKQGRFKDVSKEGKRRF